MHLPPPEAQPAPLQRAAPHSFALLTYCSFGTRTSTNTSTPTS
jgi:hypothetical protein